MKKILLSVLLLISVSLAYSNIVPKYYPLMIANEVFSFEIKPSITSEFIKIETNVQTQSILVKVIDKAGFIRIERKLHLDRDIDVSSLRKGHYLVKVYSENNMAIKRFYKGQDAVNNK